MASNKDTDNDKENTPVKGSISDRTRSKIGQPTPERKQQLAALNKIRRYKETGERPQKKMKFDPNIYDSVTEEEVQKRQQEDKEAIEDDIGDGAYLNDGKAIFDNFQRGKGHKVHNECFTLKALKGTTIYKCYGCSRTLRKKPNLKAGRETVPPIPNDIVLKRKQFQEYYDREKEELTFSKKPKFCYYHIAYDCLKRKNLKEDKVTPCIGKHEWLNLHTRHKQLLKQEFGIRDYTCEEDNH